MFMKYTLKTKGVRVANMAKIVADISAGWADAVVANIGAYHAGGRFAALITEIPGRLAEKPMAGAVEAVERGREDEGGHSTGQKRKLPELGPGSKSQFRGSGRGGGSGGGTQFKRHGQMAVTTNT